jgi:hypothetical protein
LFSLRELWLNRVRFNPFAFLTNTPKMHVGFMKACGSCYFSGTKNNSYRIRESVSVNFMGENLAKIQGSFMYFESKTAIIHDARHVGRTRGSFKL